VRLIVDGYNLALSGAVPLSSGPAEEEGRRELCALLGRYALAKGFRLTVVFDGRGAFRTAIPFKGGTALFTRAGESADDAIRELARGAPAGTVVVTSDRGLAATLAARAVTAVSCAEFAARLGARARTRPGTVPAAKDDEDLPPRGTKKKGTARRLPRKERRRERLLRKL